MDRAEDSPSRGIVSMGTDKPMVVHRARGGGSCMDRYATKCSKGSHFGYG
jgi:hypothetical protein